MQRIVRTASSLGALGAAALVLGGSALAAPSPSAEFGQHVASCAREHLGQRAGAPSVTCTHEGVTMTFATFGAMVQHMQEDHNSEAS